MAELAYPNLIDPWRLMVVPATGLPFGNGLMLHGGERDPVLARALGFVASPHGYVLDPQEPDPAFEVSLSKIGASIAELLPPAGFAYVDPVAFGVDGHSAWNSSATPEQARHRFDLRQAISRGRRAPTPSAVPLRKETTSGTLVAVAAMAMRLLAPHAPPMTGLPYATAMTGTDVVYATREADGIRIGVNGRDRRKLLVPGVVLRHARDGDKTAFVFSGRGAADVEHSGCTAAHLLCEAVHRMLHELAVARFRIPVGYLEEGGGACSARPSQDGQVTPRTIPTGNQVRPAHPRVDRGPLGAAGRPSLARGLGGQDDF
ncbi:hypothetical protein [Methylobacterium sp. 1030]|uniref:hypothetical protein n=1 Tax=Methylobacterium sp. 1030 TaxID=3156404 RepID=UPI00339AA085